MQECEPVIFFIDVISNPSVGYNLLKLFCFATFGLKSLRMEYFIPAFEFKSFVLNISGGILEILGSRLYQKRFVA